MFSRKLTKVVTGAAVLIETAVVISNSKAIAGEPLTVQPAVYRNVIEARPPIGADDGAPIEQVRWRRGWYGYPGYGYGWGGGYRRYRYGGFYRPYRYGYGGVVAPGYAYPAYAYPAYVYPAYGPAYVYPAYGPAYGYGGYW